MCVVSMVFDHYNAPFRKYEKWDNDRWQTTDSPFMPKPPAPDMSELRQLIREFREAVEAAKRVDVLTKQPDCHDPEKAKLEDRVADLERRLNAMGQ